MATSRMQSRANKVAGKIQETAGEILDDEELQAEGVGRQFDATLQEWCGQACDQVKSAACDLAKSVQRNPITAVATAGMVGFILGLLVRRD
ncbi:MAG: CsbD family protein [Pigmentiphaga sp.]|nr:CsbD family protein [Pigmentiphaga sp.]